MLATAPCARPLPGQVFCQSLLPQGTLLPASPPASPWPGAEKGAHAANGLGETKGRSSRTHGSAMKCKASSSAEGPRHPESVPEAVPQVSAGSPAPHVCEQPRNATAGWAAWPPTRCGRGTRARPAASTAMPVASGCGSVAQTWGACCGWRCVQGRLDVPKTLSGLWGSLLSRPPRPVLAVRPREEGTRRGRSPP